MEADAERYQQEYEAEMREKGLEAYDWDALCSENEDMESYNYRICENRKRNIEDGRPDGGVSRKMQSDEIRCETVPQIFSQMGYNTRY